MSVPVPELACEPDRGGLRRARGENSPAPDIFDIFILLICHHHIEAGSITRSMRATGITLTCHHLIETGFNKVARTAYKSNTYMVFRQPKMSIKPHMAPKC